VGNSTVRPVTDTLAEAPAENRPIVDIRNLSLAQEWVRSRFEVAEV